MSELSISEEKKKLKDFLQERLNLFEVPKTSIELNTYFGMAYDAIITDKGPTEAVLLLSEFEEVIEPLFKKYINKLK